MHLVKKKKGSESWKLTRQRQSRGVDAGTDKDQMGFSKESYDDGDYNDDVDDDGDGDRLGGKWVGQSHNGGEWEGICSGRGRGVSSQVRSGLRNTKYRLPALPTNEWGSSKATKDEATRKFPIFEEGGNTKEEGTQRK